MESYLEKRYLLARERINESAYEAAIAFLEKNLKDGDHPASMSLLGFSLAQAGRALHRAENLCRKAIELENDNAEHYLHLAEVCIKAHKREEAFKAVNSGLKLSPSNKELVKIYNRLRKRQQPVFTFLERAHPLNKLAGKLLANYRI